jgi:arylsulfatase A-like enzyme
MYPSRTNLTDWIPGWGKQYGSFPLLPPKWTQHLEQQHTSLAEALHDAGYTTQHLGKWHLGGTGDLPENHGFDVNIGGSIRGCLRATNFPYGGEAMKWHSNFPESQREGRYLTNRLADEAVARPPR